MKAPIKINRIINFSILIFISLIISGCAGLKTGTANEAENFSAENRSSLHNTIISEMKTKKITGLAIAVADSKGIIWSEGFGFSDKRNNKTFNNETISNVGSVSKLITAAAVMKLARSRQNRS